MPKIAAVREGARWAIKHGAGYLGHVDSETEASALIAALLDADGHIHIRRGGANPLMMAGDQTSARLAA